MSFKQLWFVIISCTAIGLLWLVLNIRIFDYLAASSGISSSLLTLVAFIWIPMGVAVLLLLWKRIVEHFWNV